MKQEDLVKTFRTVREGIAGAVMKMHHRDFVAADKARELLGIDTYCDDLMAQWNALPEVEREKIESSGDLGKYGVYSISTSEPVTSALKVYLVDLVALNPELIQIPELRLGFDYEQYFASLEPKAQKVEGRGINIFGCAEDVLKDDACVQEIKKRFPETMTEDRVERVKMFLCLDL